MLHCEKFLQIPSVIHQPKISGLNVIDLQAIGLLRLLSYP